MTSPVNFTETRGGFVYGFVRGLSMWPALIPGDLLRALPVAAVTLEPGNVVVLPSGKKGAPVVHRLLRLEEGPDGGLLLHTAGDRGGVDQPLGTDPEDKFLKITGVLRRRRWRRPGSSPPSWICRLPAIFVRLHCAAVRRLEW